MPAVLEQVLGAALLLVTLADVFLTVLYARAGISLIGRPLALGIWRLFRTLARPAGSKAGQVLSFCGPAVVVSLVLAWAFLLTFGTALIVHPVLGGAVRAEIGPTPRDLLTALYAGGEGVSIVQANNMSPHTSGYRLIFLFTSLTGMAVVSLTITYLMQVYSTLQRRNALALDVHSMTGETGDGARLVAALGAGGHFEATYTNIATLASQVTEVTEAHHFYPVLFYFYFPEDSYAVARFTFTLLDAVTLMRTALDERAAGWVQRSASLEHLERGCMALALMLQRIYLAGQQHNEEASPELKAAWRERYGQAVLVLREAGVPLRRDFAAGALQYAERRARWDDLVLRIGQAMLLTPPQIDPATAELQPPPVSGAPQAAGASPAGR